MWRSNAHCVVRKNGWVFTSDAPARDPRRRSSSLVRSLRMSDLQLLQSSQHYSCAQFIYHLLGN